MLEEAVARMQSYGEIFGREDAAAGLVADLRSRIEDARTAVQDKGDALILPTNGGKLSA